MLARCGGHIASQDDGGAAGTTYHDMSDGAFWSAFDVSTLDSGAGFFAAATFDGRYVDFAGFGTTLMARYDTSGSFSAPTAWSAFDTKTGGFAGTAFDGHDVYLVPGSALGGIVRFDATKAIPSFETASVGTSSSFAGATFDGRYLYLAPATTAQQGAPVAAARHDTTASFPSAWTSFVTSTANAEARNFTGAVFDGRYVYFVPSPTAQGGSVVPNGTVARYDTTGAFDAAGSWATFDVGEVNAGANMFDTGAFDGRYLYLVPYGKQSSAGPTQRLMARYDTTADFTNKSSWSTFDTSAVADAQCFGGSTFDGRYLYLVPSCGSTTVTRYDSTASFTASASWSAFDTKLVNPSGGGYATAVFDGRYVYLAPNDSGVVVRFDAKTPPSMPALPGWHGSFF